MPYKRFLVALEPGNPAKLWQGNISLLCFWPRSLLLTDVSSSEPVHLLELNYLHLKGTEKCEAGQRTHINISREQFLKRSPPIWLCVTGVVSCAGECVSLAP